MTEETTDKSLLIYLAVNLKAIIGNKVNNDIIVVSGIKCDFITSF